jgi:hypothetical protein
MFFGLCNLPSTFQAMMDNIFSDLMDENIVIIYMDDIFLFSKHRETLQTNTKRVLQCLKENNLYLKPTKCEFEQEKVEWLGLVIEEGKISMDPGNCHTPGTHDDPPAILLDAVYISAVLYHFGTPSLKDSISSVWKGTYHPGGVKTTEQADYKALIYERDQAAKNKQDHNRNFRKCDECHEN